MIPVLAQTVIFISAAQATNYKEDSFKFYAVPEVNDITSTISVFSGLHIQENKRLVLLSGEIIIPIVYGDGESISLTGNVGYSVSIGGYDSYLKWNDEILPSGAWDSTSKINVYIGDFNGDGHADQLLQSKAIPDVDKTLLIIYGSDNSLPLSIETVESPSASWTANYSHLHASVAKITVDDFDEDGKSDIRIDYIDGEYANKFQHMLYGSDKNVSVRSTSPSLNCN